MIKKLMLVIFSAHLSSCVVLREEYFLPEADGATVEKEFCRGKVGVENQLVYNLENIEAKLNVWEYKGVIRLGITFKVFDDGSIVWPSQTLELHTDNNKLELRVDGFTRLRFENRYQSNDLLEKEYTINSVMDRTTEEESEVYNKSFIVPNKEINKLKITKIRVLINGKEHILSNLVFTKTSGMFLHPLNC